VDQPQLAEPSTTLLVVQDLSVELTARDGPVWALDRVHLTLLAGECVGILGESGSGKTTLALTICGLLPAGGRVVSGTVRWRGQPLETLREAQLARLRGAEIGLVFQEPHTALHPLLRVGSQVRAVWRAHDRGPRQEAKAAALAVLVKVGFADPERIYAAYPHQLSGGERQRIALAQALIAEPALVIADEPTAALDAVAAARVLALLQELQQGAGLAWLYISHDPHLLAAVADRLLVLYGGRVVEEGPTPALLQAPRHPYTQALLADSPSAAQLDPAQARAAPAIPDSPVIQRRPATGCSFAPRCSCKMKRCEVQVPSAIEVAPEHRVGCFQYGPDQL
jgi:peptide/nickel transport system ATP-binding protein